VAARTFEVGRSSADGLPPAAPRRVSSMQGGGSARGEGEGHRGAEAGAQHGAAGGLLLPRDLITNSDSDLYASLAQLAGRVYGANGPKLNALGSEAFSLASREGGVVSPKQPMPPHPVPQGGYDPEDAALSVGSADCGVGRRAKEAAKGLFSDTEGEEVTPVDGISLGSPNGAGPGPAHSRGGRAEPVRRMAPARDSVPEEADYPIEVPEKRKGEAHVQ
jgi:hypothetical protein